VEGSGRGIFQGTIPQFSCRLTMCACMYVHICI
jgi:hypothetical protein